jgi:RNA 3'-terminal phosphate cyclase
MGIKQKLRTSRTKAPFEKSSPGDICRDEQGSRIDSDKVGRPGRRSESIGRYVAERIIEDVKTGATVDEYIAEQFIIYAGLAEGRVSMYLGSPALLNMWKQTRGLSRNFLTLEQK